MLTSATVAITIAIISIANAAIVQRPLYIQNVKINPDGFAVRSATVANGSFPGPLIKGFKNDRFEINVIDQLTDPTMRRATSIHWHGVFQHHTPEMDGPAAVTQCPIIPGHSFLYNFSVPDQAGTFWYHSHYSTQYCDGLRGPLVIYDHNDPLAHMYDIDDESTIITLADWYHTPAPELFPKLTIDEPGPNSTLINGLGKWDAKTGQLAVIRGQNGKRHRFRIISTSCNPSYKFSIDLHRMTVIEADGIETEPVTVDQLEIFPGQRYSVVVNMDKPVPGNYWIRAVPSEGPSSTVGGMNSAILRYGNAAPFNPTTCPSKNPVVLDQSDLHPYVKTAVPGLPFPGGADRVIPLVTDITSDGRLYTINNASFYPAPLNMPSLLQILSGQTNASRLLPKDTYYSLPLNSSIEIIITGGFNHPFHMHGHAFDVVKVPGASAYNFRNPVRRDTINIGEVGDNVTLRFMTDNTGPWFLHCHIDWHLEAGMGVVLVEGPDDIAIDDPPNADWRALCPLFNASNPDTHLEPH